MWCVNGRYLGGLGPCKESFSCYFPDFVRELSVNRKGSMFWARFTQYAWYDASRYYNIIYTWPYRGWWPPLVMTHAWSWLTHTRMVSGWGLVRVSQRAGYFHDTSLSLRGLCWSRLGILPVIEPHRRVVKLDISLLCFAYMSYRIDKSTNIL